MSPAANQIRRAETRGGGDLRDDAVMRFEFDETSGSTTYDTAEGSSQTASLPTGATLIAFDGERVLDFDNVASDIGVSGTLDYCPDNSPFSIEAMFYLDAYTSNFPHLCTLKTGQGGGYIVLPTLQAAYTTLTFGRQTAGAELRISAAVAAAAWHHLVITHDGTGTPTIARANCYLNNVSRTITASGGFGAYTDATKLELGSNSNFRTNGKKNFIRAYDKVLTVDEVATLYGFTGL